MHRYRLAVWLLRSAVPHAQAEGIVGDVAEISHRRELVFWGHIARVLAAFLWWPTLVLLLTLPLESVVTFWMDGQAANHFWFVKVQQPSLLFQADHLQIWNGSLWEFAAFAILRYGPKEKAWVLSASAAFLVTGFTASSWLPSLRTPIFVGALFLVCWIISRRGWRRPAVMVLLSMSFGIMVQGGVDRMFTFFSRLHQGPGKLLFLTLAPLLLATPFTPICYATLRREAMWNKAWTKRLSPS